MLSMGSTATLTATPLTTLLPRSRAARLLTAGALLFAASAVFHTFILAADGWQLSGAVSWRKPVVFSISLGSTAWAMGWMIDRLPPRPRLSIGLALTYLVGAVVELFLIAMQTWRGRPSHFNVFASDDAAVFALMGVAVGVISLALVGLFVWMLVERPRHGALRWASIGGMVFVLAGLGLGQWLIDLGFEFVERAGVVPETVMYGAAGVAKFPHAVAFHGIHVFMLLVAVMGPAVSAPRSAQIMRLAVGSYGAIVLFAATQTVLGLAPSAISMPLVVLGVGGAVGLSAAFLRAWQGRQGAATTPVLVDA